MKNFLCIFAILLLLGHTSRSATAQCVSIYTDVTSQQDARGNITVSAWNILTDQGTNSSGCGSSMRNYYHMYNAHITIMSPSGRQASAQGGGQQQGGTGTGTSQAEVSLGLNCDTGDTGYPGACELGDYSVSDVEDDIYCSAFGPYYNYAGFGPKLTLRLAVSVLQFQSMLNGSCHYVLSCPNGNQNATCQSGPADISPPCGSNYLVTGFLAVKSTNSLRCFGTGPAVLTNTPVDCQ